jgi:hypothetical protein
VPDSRSAISGELIGLLGGFPVALLTASTTTAGVHPESGFSNAGRSPS